MNPLNFEFKDGYLVESLEQPIINQALEIIIGGNSTNLGRHYQVVSTLNSSSIIFQNWSFGADSGVNYLEQELWFKVTS